LRGTDSRRTLFTKMSLSIVRSAQPGGSKARSVDYDHGPRNPMLLQPIKGGHPRPFLSLATQPTTCLTLQIPHTLSTPPTMKNQIVGTLLEFRRALMSQCAFVAPPAGFDRHDSAPGPLGEGSSCATTTSTTLWVTDLR